MSQASRVRVVGGCEPDELLLLRTLINRLPGMWSMVDGDDANVVLYNLDSEAGRSAWDARDKDAPSVAHVALISSLAATGARYSVERPWRASVLKDVLQRARAELLHTDRPNPRKIGLPSLSGQVRELAEPDAPVIGEYDPDSLLLGLLRSLSGNDPVAIGPIGEPVIIVRPNAGEAWTVWWPRLIALARTPAADIQQQTIARPDVPALRFQGLNNCRLDELIWFAALEGSQGRPLRTFGPDIAVRLTTQPDFTKLYRRPVHVRIAYVMSRRWLQIEQIAKAARTSAFEVTNLCNACACLGLIDFKTAESQDPLPSPASTKPSQVFQRIFDRLAQARGGAA